MQLAAKGRKFAHVKASKIADLDWERHKPTLIDLYIGQSKTVTDIRDFMSTEYAFIANKQQYQKKFRSWRLTKNISSSDWIALSQQLKRLYITLDDIDPEYGSIDIAFNGQALAFSKVKKGIYRYDTSLLKGDEWCNDAHFASVSKLQKTLRSIITRCVIKDKNSLLGMRMPKNLTALLLLVSDTGKASNQSANHHAWSLKRKSAEELIVFPAGGEQAVFRSCIQSISSKHPYATVLTILTFEEINHHWAMFLKDEMSSQANLRNVWCNILPVLPESLETTGYFAVLQILMVTLFYCIVQAPDLTLGNLKLSEVVELSSLSMAGLDILYCELLEILLFTAASQGDTALCEQLMTTSVNLDVIRPCSHSILHEYVDSTALQISLTIDDNSGPRPKHGVLMVLLKAGADPNLCGKHGKIQLHGPICCGQLPLSLAFRQSSTILRALIDAGARIPETLCLMTAFHKIADIGVLSILLDKGVSPEGTSSFTVDSWSLCPLQAALHHQNREAAFRLLENVRNGLGCSPRRLQEAREAYTSLDSLLCGHFDYDFRTPFTHAVLHHFFDIASELLKKGADADKSYLDYMWSDLSRWREVRYDLSATDKYIFSASARPLQATVSKNDLFATRFILSVGANPNYSPINELSALAIATCQCNEPIISLLCEHDAFVSFQDICFFIITTRSEKQKLTQLLMQSQEDKDRIKHLANRLKVLGRVIGEIKLEEDKRDIETLLGKQCRATATQFARLLEAW